jgi:hypothetical protein
LRPAGDGVGLIFSTESLIANKCERRVASAFLAVDVALEEALTDLSVNKPLVPLNDALSPIWLFGRRETIVGAVGRDRLSRLNGKRVRRLAFRRRTLQGHGSY